MVKKTALFKSIPCKTLTTKEKKNTPISPHTQSVHITFTHTHTDMTSALSSRDKICGGSLLTLKVMAHRHILGENTISTREPALWKSR